MTEFGIKVDYEEFARDARRIAKHEYPEKIVGGFSELSEVDCNEVRAATRAKFKLHTEYIPRGVKNIPSTPAQKKAAARAVEKYGDIFAAVYLRAATDPKRSLDFMVLHEESGEKEPHGGSEFLAIPTATMKHESGFKTPRGRVRKRWKPKTLLQRFREKRSSFDEGQHTTTNKGRILGKQPRKVPGHAFIIRGRGGSMMIARRKTLTGFRNLEFLYALVPQAQIKERWDFESTVWVTTRDRYVSILTKWVNKIKGKGV